MKILCFISAFLVLLLSVKPCCTDADCGYQTNSRNLTSQSAPQEKDCKGCSPFFTCGTCTGFVVTQAVIYTAKAGTEPPLKHLCAYRHPYVEMVTLSIWQPPQIG